MVISDNNSVRVAVRIRPQNARERAEHSNICTSVIPGVPQISIGDNKSFTYDFVFDQFVDQPQIYDDCIRELVEGTFDGYNATVLAYGQTGSGKTFTMGTSFDPSSQSNAGIIPRAAQHIYNKIEQLKVDAKESGVVEPAFEIQVQFIELYNEEIVDLLAEERRHGSIKIHEDPTKGEIYLKGVTSVQLNSANDILNSLRGGALNRTTAATNMNQQSSRSHAIFTVLIKQQRMVFVDNDDAKNLSINGNPAPLTELEVLTAKFHFVDLAGSERLKRTGATGDRAKEGISINSGLLALGNVISALGGGSGRVQHVPYRDSKLTRLLQDSLGGNSRTLMIACASPSDEDFVETLNTLNYANRAKNIKNKVVANQDKSSKLIGELRGRIAALEAELNEYKQGKKLIGEDGIEIVNDQYLENVSLQHENNRLRTRVKALDEAMDILKTRCLKITEELELKKLGIVIKANADDDSVTDNSVTTAIRGYLNEIEDLRVQLDEARSTNDELRKQNARFRTQAQAGSLSSSPYIVKSNNTSVLIKAAKDDIKKQKLLILAQTRGVNTNTDANENLPEDENSSPANNALDQIDEECVIDYEENSDEASGSDEENNENISKERDRICNDLAELQEDISIKERLVAELEQKEKRLAQLRHDYERRVNELSGRITTMEAERDRILSEMTSKSNGKHSEEKIRQVKEDYEKRLGSLRGEFKKYQSIEKEHRRMQLQQQKQLEDMRRIQNEISVMKKNKVELMRKLKEENKRAREIEIVNLKRLASMEKIKRQHENQIRLLKLEANHKAETLKRKNEEVQKLREKQKKTESRRVRLNPFSGVNSVKRDELFAASSQPFTPIRSKRISLNTTTVIYSPVRAKRQWNTIENVVTRLITQKQTISKMEDDLVRQMKERHALQEEFKKLENIDLHKLSHDERLTINEQRQSIKEKINYVSNQIMNLQNAIVDVDFSNKENDDTEDSPNANEPTSLDALVEQCGNMIEAKYLLHHLLNSLVEKGLLYAKSEYDKKELTARIQQMETESRISEQLMSHLIDGGKKNNPDINEVMLLQNSPIATPFLSSSSSYLQVQQQQSTSFASEKVRRRTATTEELLFAPLQSTELLTKTNSSVEFLKPIAETMSASINGTRNVTPVSEMKKSTCSNFEDDDGYSQSSFPSGSMHLKRISKIVKCSDEQTIGSPLLQKTHIARGHTRQVNCVHANQCFMLSGSRDRTARLWDLEQGKEILILPNHLNNVNFVHLLPEENHLAITGSMFMAKVWDLRSGLCVRHLLSSGMVGEGENEKTSRRNDVPLAESIIYTCVVDANSKFMFTSFGSSVRVWSLENFQTVFVLSGNHVEAVSCMAICDSPSKNIRIICGSRDCKVSVYDFNSKTMTCDLRGILQSSHKELVSAACVNNDSVFSGSRDKDIMQSSLRDFKRSHLELNAHSKSISAMCIIKTPLELNIFQPNDAYLVSVCRAGTMKLWDVTSSSRMHLANTITNAHKKGIHDVCYNSKILFTASDDETVAFWRPTMAS